MHGDEGLATVLLNLVPLQPQSLYDSKLIGLPLNYLGLGRFQCHLQRFTLALNSSLSTFREPFSIFKPKSTLLSSVAHLFRSPRNPLRSPNAYLMFV